MTKYIVWLRPTTNSRVNNGAQFFRICFFFLFVFAFHKIGRHGEKNSWHMNITYWKDMELSIGLGARYL